MKANELMIGDWVSLSKKDIAPCVVTGLHPKELFVLQPEWSAGEVFSYDTIYPIPISAEILKKNAYPDDGCWYSFGDFYVAQYGDCYVIHQNPDDDKRDFLCRISYVHELQRALRLCGLNDLADNFKV